MRKIPFCVSICLRDAFLKVSNTSLLNYVLLLLNIYLFLFFYLCIVTVHFIAFYINCAFVVDRTQYILSLRIMRRLCIVQVNLLPPLQTHPLDSAVFLLNGGLLVTGRIEPYIIVFFLTSEGKGEVTSSSSRVEKFGEQSPK